MKLCVVSFFFSHCLIRAIIQVCKTTFCGTSLLECDFTTDLFVIFNIDYNKNNPFYPLITVLRDRTEKKQFYISF